MLGVDALYLSVMIPRLVTSWISCALMWGLNHKLRNVAWDWMQPCAGCIGFGGQYAQLTAEWQTVCDLRLRVSSARSAEHGHGAEARSPYTPGLAMY